MDEQTKIKKLKQAYEVFSQKILPVITIGCAAVVIVSEFTKKNPAQELLNRLKENSIPIVKRVVIDSSLTGMGLQKTEIVDTVGYYIPAEKFKPN